MSEVFGACGFAVGGSNSLVSAESELGPVQSEELPAQRASSGPTHKRTEGRAPVWGSEFSSKDLKNSI